MDEAILLERHVRCSGGSMYLKRRRNRFASRSPCIDARVSRKVQRRMPNLSEQIVDDTLKARVITGGALDRRTGGSLV